MKSPIYNTEIILDTYMWKSDPLKGRIRLMVILKGIYTDLLGESKRPDKFRPMMLSKRTHKMTEEHREQAIRIW